MKEINDDNAYKFMGIVYTWWKTVLSNYGVGGPWVRKAWYSDKDYYVIKIGRPLFLEPDGFVRKEDITEEAIKYGRMLGWENYLSLDQLADLNTQLKEAGATKVYIHPSQYMPKHIPSFKYGDEVPLERDNELLIVIETD